MMQTADCPENKKPLLLPRLISIVAGLLVGGVFYLVSWFILIKGLHFPVEQFFDFSLNNWQFWATWLLLMVYIGEWVVYFFVSSKTRFDVLTYHFFLVIMIVYLLLWWSLPGLNIFFWLTCLALYGSAVVIPSIIRGKVWTLRGSIGHHFEQYLNKAGKNELRELREKANVTKQTVAVLLSLSGVVISIYILGGLRLPSLEQELHLYREVFFSFMGLALISALALLFVSLESLDTAANPLFDDTGKKNYLDHLYSGGTKWYLVGLACFMFSLLCGLAIVEMLISLIGTVLFLIFILFHNYYCIEN